MKASRPHGMEWPRGKTWNYLRKRLREGGKWTQSGKLELRIEIVNENHVVLWCWKESDEVWGRFNGSRMRRCEMREVGNQVSKRRFRSKCDFATITIDGNTVKDTVCSRNLFTKQWKVKQRWWDFEGRKIKMTIEENLGKEKDKDIKLVTSSEKIYLFCFSVKKKFYCSFYLLTV